MNIFWKQSIITAGAFIAFLVGSGFVTGQEVLQYFAGYGYKGILGVILVFLLLCYVSCSFLIVGQKKQFAYANEIYSYYGGKYLGKFYDYFSVIVVYSSFIAMVTGAGAVLNQYCGVQIYIGCIFSALLSLLTVLMGLKNIIKILGNVGFVNVFIVLFLSIGAFLLSDISLSEANQLTFELNILHASANWFTASFSYIGICMLWLAAFLTAAGKNIHNKKTAVCGGLLGSSGFFIAVLFFTLALLCNIKEIYSLMIPALFLAKRIHSFFADIFFIFILVCIYIASVPLLWSSASRFTDEKNKKFKIITSLLAIIGMFIGFVIPFNLIVNYIYVMNGYVGIGLLVLMCCKDIKKIKIQKS